MKTADIAARLSTDLAPAICRQIVSIGDSIFTLEEKLVDSGFLAHNARSNFDESFARSPSDIDLHRRIEVEVAKRRLGTVDDLSFPPPAYVYSSDLLMDLAARREKDNGCSFVDISKKYPGEPWRKEIDPCMREYRFYAMRKNDEFSRREEAYEEERRRLFRDDVFVHSCGLSNEYQWHGDGRRIAFVQAMQRAFGPLGFGVAEKYQGTIAAPFSKTVTSRWSIAWIAGKSIFTSDQNAMLELVLLVLPSALVGRRLKPGQALRVRHDLIVPGFFNGYALSDSLDELDTAIQAHATLFALCQEDIEAACRLVLI